MCDLYIHIFYPCFRHIYSNVISQIPTGSLAGQTQLSVFSIYDNLITEITSDMFTDATNIQHM